jgi:hypothetical protein
MRQPPPHLILTDPDERLALRLGASKLFYRRLSLGQLAALERQQALRLPPLGEAPARGWIPPAALEAALVAQALVGWEGVCDGRGELVEFSPQAASRLPAGVRRILNKRAHKLHPSQEGDS